MTKNIYIKRRRDTYGNVFHEMEIEIRCNDECKNGHDTFSITGSIWYKGDRRNDPSYCGCIHDEILKQRPDLQPLVELHLSDGDGVPMYAVENGWYHLHKSSKETFVDYMHIDLDYNKVKAMDKLQFIQWVDSCRPIWKKQADLAKKLIEKL